VLIGLNPLAKALKPEHRGLVLEVEHRRKSGRGVLEWFFLPTLHASQLQQFEKVDPSTAHPFKEDTVILLADHPLFRPQQIPNTESDGAGLEEEMTFSLSLTERQRRERDGVILPYFDAQKSGGGPGEGGRILYDMSVEDDFDDEEDEI